MRSVARAVAAALVLTGRAEVWELAALAFARGVGYAFCFPDAGLLPQTVLISGQPLGVELGPEPDHMPRLIRAD